MSDSGDQTNLGQEKNSSKQLLKKTLFPMKGLIFITSFPTFLSSSNLAAKKGLISSHFAQNSTLSGMKRGCSAVILTDIPGKVPKVLTSIVPK